MLVDTSLLTFFLFVIIKWCYNKKYNMEEDIPYSGAKPMYLVKNINNHYLLKEIVEVTCNDLNK